MSESFNDEVYGQSNRKDIDIRLFPNKKQERVNSSKTRSAFKRIRLYEKNTLLNNTYVDSEIFDARLYKTVLTHIINPDATLTLQYKLLACIDPENWRTLVAETDLLPLANIPLTTTEIWAFLKLQARAKSPCPIAKAFSCADGVFRDETAAINSAAANDVFLPPISNSPSSRWDMIYFGGSFKFTSITVNVGTAGNYEFGSGALYWEYWNGSEWVALEDLVDGTNGFKNAGSTVVSYTLPSDWAKNAVNSETYYWIRCRVYAEYIDTRPYGTQAWLAGASANIKAFMSGKVP